MHRPWITLFSQTGSEIVNISNRLKQKPDLIITNKPFDSDTTHPDLTDIVYMPDRPTSQDYLDIFKLYNDPLITLHGWLRIIPGDICDMYNIINLHPGLITRYPELKGKDPQWRVFRMENLPSRVGCVIHQATAQVDSGEILMERSTLNHFPNGDVLCRHLHWMATDMWTDYLSMIYDTIEDDE